MPNMRIEISLLSSMIINHDGELEGGAAEKFIEWAKKEKLNFWK